MGKDDPPGESSFAPGRRPGVDDSVPTPFSASECPSCLLLRSIAHRPVLYNSSRLEPDLIIRPQGWGILGDLGGTPLFRTALEQSPRRAARFTTVSQDLGTPGAAAGRGTA